MEYFLMFAKLQNPNCFQEGHKSRPIYLQAHLVTATDFKITDKVVHDQTNEFLSDNKIFITISLDSELTTCLICVYLS